MAGAAPKDWGTCALDGKDVKLITITAPNGCYATVTNYGATLTSIFVPDRSGELGDVLLGYDNLPGYESHVVSMGATVGRFANRIAKGKFSLDGTEYTLVQNHGQNCLHGGIGSFDNKTWDVVSSTARSVVLKYESPDMEENFPGRLITTVEFAFTSAADDSNNTALHIRYTADTDKATVLNLTNHAYFNLLGHGGGTVHPSILDHVVTINTDLFLPVDDSCIPIGELRSVRDTPFDLSMPTKIGDKVDIGHAQLIFAGGFDHCYALTAGTAKSTPAETPQGMRELGVAVDAAGVPKRTRKPDAVMTEPTKGRRLETFTEEPGLHFFTDNIPNDVLGLGGKGKHGVDPGYTHRTGVCFETQHYPDSPNQKSFPSTVLRPGSTYKSETVYWFTVDD